MTKIPSFAKDVVHARCPSCASGGGALSSFVALSNFERDGAFDYQNSKYARATYYFMKCGGCNRGALAVVYHNGIVQSSESALEFYPSSRETTPLPKGIPEGIVAEYREAELCASFGAYRAASALLRSALEKTLYANGYEKGSLHDRIDQVAKDGLITAARQRRAHDNVRDLGNDVLHEEWRGVSEEEYSGAHLYVQRILEDFYDHRSEVETVLLKAKRIQPPIIAGAGTTSPDPVSSL